MFSGSLLFAYSSQMQEMHPDEFCLKKIASGGAIIIIKSI